MTVAGYEYAPLIMTLVDMRFSSIPGFHDNQKLAQVESLLRDFGYIEKVVEKTKSLAIKFQKNEKTGGIEQVKESIPEEEKQRWIFLDLDRTTSVYLSETAISLKTTNYSTHDDFLEKFKKVISCVSDVYPDMKKGIISRIGTRYLNLIVPCDGMDVSRYLKEQWLPNNTLDCELKVSPNVHNRLTMNYETERGNLRLESNLFHPKPDMEIQIIPNELSDNPDASLNIKGQFWWRSQFEQNKSYAILDIDLVSNFRKLFDIDLVIGELDSMRQVSKPAFESCITEEARNDWKVKEA